MTGVSIYLLFAAFFTYPILFASAAVSVPIKGTCLFTIPDDIPEQNEPIYLTTTDNGFYQLYVPTGEKNHFKNGEKIVLACPGANNGLTNNAGSIQYLLCMNGSFSERIHTIKCKSEVKSSYSRTKNPCGTVNNENQGRIVMIGFQIDKERFVKLFEVCYNFKTASLVYSIHTIYGPSMSIKSTSKRPPFFTSIKTNDKVQKEELAYCYFTGNLTARLTNLLGETVQDQFLDRGHSVAHSDYSLKTWKWATFTLANVYPQYRVYNGRNWQLAENLIRQIAAAKQTNFQVYTGSFGVLELKNNRGELVKMSLIEGDYVEVPKLIYKVILRQTQNGNEAIAFITPNHPSVTNQFCPNMCQRAKIPEFIRNAFEIQDNGHTLCCRLDDLRAKVNTLPATLTARDLLKVDSGEGAIIEDELRRFAPDEICRT